jgi:hypothetical protein
MKLKLWQKNVLSMLLIALMGFVLFFAAFMLAFFVSSVCDKIIMLFADKAVNPRAIHFSWHYIYLILVLLLSWFVFRTGLNDLAKAAFSTLPLAVILAETGVQFYRLPVLVYVSGAVIIGAILFYLYKKKLSWMYYFAVLYVTAVMLFVMLSGMDI